MATSLTWIRDNYDKNKNGVIDASEKWSANADWRAGRITAAQSQAVMSAYTSHTKLPAYPTSSPGKGQIVNFNYPTTGKQGARIPIRAAVKNTGGTTAQFKLYVYRGSTKLATSATVYVEPSKTSATKTMYVNLPGSGTMIAYQLRCARAT